MSSGNFDYVDYNELNIFKKSRLRDFSWVGQAGEKHRNCCKPIVPFHHAASYTTLSVTSSEDFGTHHKGKTEKGLSY